MEIKIDLFSNYGTNWVKAAIMTLLFGLIFYSGFYAISNSEKEFDLLSSAAYNNFFIGYFRYLLVTDYSNPLTKDRQFLSNAIEWIPFIIGKFFISVGIYETIVSFRKF